MLQVRLLSSLSIVPIQHLNNLDTTPISPNNLGISHIHKNGRSALLFSFNPGSGGTPSEHVTSDHLSQAADNPLDGNSLYISCGLTPKNVVTSDLCNPGNANSNTSFTIRNTEQRKAGNRVLPSEIMHVTTSRKGQAKVSSGPHLFDGGKRAQKQTLLVYSGYLPIF